MIGLKFRDALAGSSPFVVEELDNLVAGVRGLWGVQHRDDGSHGQILADGLVALGAVQAPTATFGTLHATTFTADSFVASGAGLPARASATDLVWVDSVGALRRGTLVASDIPTLPESKLSNDALLARVADNEAISGAWTFSGIATFSAAPVISQVNAPATLTLSPTGDIIMSPGGKDVLPAANYDTNLGMLSKKYLSLHAAELWVETLVAQETLATIGGRVLVGPTTVLTSDLASGSTSIIVKHNSLASGDVVYLESSGKVEFLRITSAASGSGPYTYTVERNKDGTSANDWFAGDAVFNTGQSGNGFIDLYSVRGIRSASEAGPTIVGNVRTASGTSSTDPGVNNYAAWSPRWAVGNLNGLYGYSANTYGAAFGDPNAAHVLIDPTNGIRLRHGSTTKIALDMSGNASFTGTVTITGSSSGYSNLTDKPTTLAGVNASEGSKLAGIAAGATVGATWGTNLGNIPAVLGAPSGSGLFLASTHMGYYASGAWKTYIQNNGNFYFAGDASNYISWDGLTLTIRGTLDAGDISSGILTGRTVRTAASGARIEMTASPNELVWYDSGGTRAGSLSPSGLKIEQASGSSDGPRQITLGTAGSLSGQSALLILSGSGSAIVETKSASGEARLTSNTGYVTISAYSGGYPAVIQLFGNGTSPTGTRKVEISALEVLPTLSGATLGNSTDKWGNIHLSLPAASSPNYVVAGKSASSSDLGYILGYSGSVSVRKGDNSGALTLTFSAGVLTSVA